MRRLANRNALLAKLVDGEVKCVVDLDFEAPKTADFKDAGRRRRRPHLPGRPRQPDNRNAALSARNLADCRHDPRRPAQRVRAAQPPLPGGRQGLAARRFLDGSCLGPTEKEAA